jgi:multidrug resistance efflux pump
MLPRRLALLLLPALALLVAGACRREEPTTLELAGTLEARTVEVGSLVGGRVAAVKIEEGAEVAAGQVLVELEATLIEPQLERQRAVVAAAREQLALAEKGPRSETRERARVEWEASKTDLGRIDSLFRDGVVGRAELDAAHVREAVARQTWEEANRGSRAEEIATARAVVERENAQLTYLERQREELTVRAPVAGRVEAFDLRPGDLVAPNQAVATLLEPNQIWVRVYVPETQLGHVHPGDRVTLRVDTYGGRSFPGRVIEIRHQAEYLPRNVQTLDQRGDQVFAVRVEPDPSPDLRPGMAASVTIDFGGQARP